MLAIPHVQDSLTVGPIRGFQTLPSAPQSWDRSHCSVQEILGVQYVKSEVHKCWLTIGVVCQLSSFPRSPLVPQVEK